MSVNKAVVILFVYLFSVHHSVMGLQYQWSGSVDTYWNTPGNWNPNSVPGVDDTALFNATSANCALNSDISIRSIMFTATYTGQFTMANWRIAVSGDIDFSSGGSFIVTADDTLECNSNSLQKLVSKPVVVLPFIIKDGTGTLEVHDFGFKSMGFLLKNGNLSNFSALNDTVNNFACTGGRISLNSGSLVITGNADFSGIQNFEDTTGTINFDGAGNQIVKSNPLVRFPAIEKNSSYNLAIGNNHFRARSLKIVYGQVIMDTSFSIDSINVSYSAGLILDTTGDQKDSIGYINGNGMLAFGSTILHIKGDANFSYFNSLSGNAEIEFESFENRTFIPKDNFIFNKIKKIGNNTLIIDMHGLHVNILDVLGGTLNWATYNDTIYDTLCVKNATMNLGNNTIVFRSLIDSNSVINFDYGTLVRSGNSGKIDLSAANGLTWNYGGINFEGLSGATVTLVPSSSFRLPPIRINGNDTVKVNGNFKGTTIIQNNGGWDWGNNFSHTVHSVSVSGGMVAFGNSTVAIDSGNLVLEGAGEIRSGTATILFNADSGIQSFTPPSSSSLILPQISKCDTSTLQILNHEVRCRSFRQTAGKIGFSGYGILADSCIVFENVDSLLNLDGVTLQAGHSVHISGASGKMINCNTASSQWYINVPGNLTAENAIIGNCLVTGTSGIVYPPYINAGGNSNWIFWVDTFPPDNDLVLNLQALDTGRVRIWWNPGSIDSSDADKIGIRYSSSKMPDSIGDISATLLGQYKLSDSVDTVINLNAHTTYHFAAAVSDKSGNWTDFTLNSKKLIRTRAVAPYSVTAPDTVRRQPFSIFWVNPSGLKASDSIFIHTATAGSSIWTLYSQLSSVQAFVEIVLPAAEGSYRYMISTSHDSAGIYYPEDVFIGNVTYSVNPPVIIIPKDTFYNYNPLISWRAPAGMGIADSFFVFSDTITGKNWVQRGQYASNILSHTFSFNNYGSYKVMVSTSWDKLGKIEQNNVAVNTLILVPSGKIYTWDNSPDSGYQASNGTWGSDRFWSNDGKSLAGWPGAGNTACFSAATTHTVVGINGAQYADSIVFNASGYSISGGTVVLSTGIIRGTAVDTISSTLSSKTITKTGTGEIVLTGKMLCDTLNALDGALTINRSDIDTEMVPGVLSVYSRFSGYGPIAKKMITFNTSSITLGGGFAKKITIDNLSMSASCTLNVDIGTQSDTLSVKNTAVANGCINISATKGFGKGAYPVIISTGTMIDSGIKVGKIPYSNYTCRLNKEKGALVLYVDTLLIDTVKPYVKINIASGSYLKKMPSVISGNAIDSISGLLSVSLLINKSKDSTYWNGTDWQKETYWLQVMPESLWTFTSSGIIGSEGKYVIKAGTTDSAGNMAYDTTNFIIDTTAPLITKMFENLDSIGSWSGLISGEAVDSISIIKQVRVSVKNDSGMYYDGKTWVTSEIYLVCGGTRQWSRQIDTNSLRKGVYTVSAVAVDTLENISFNPYSKVYNYFLKKDTMTLPPENLIQVSVANAGDSLTTIQLKSENTDSVEILFGFGELKEAAVQNVKKFPNKDTTFSFRTIIPGKIYCAYAVIDLSGNRSSFNYDSVQITNTSPRLQTLTDTIIYERSTLVRTIQAYDINNDSISFSLPLSGSGMNITGTVFNWTPGSADIGSHSVIIECRDKRGAITCDTFNIVVKDIPETPDISYVGKFEIFEDSSYEGIINVTDHDNADTPNVSIVKLPAWMKLSENKLTGTPKNEDVGICSVELICTDQSSLSDTLAFQIRVVNTDDQPEVISNSILDTLTEKQKYTFEITINDVDENDSLTVKSLISKPWLKVSSLKKADIGKEWIAQISCTPVQIDTGLHDIKFEIADRASAVAYLSKKIKVLDSDDPPAKPVLTRRVVNGAVQISVSATDDRDAQLIYSVKMRALKNDSTIYKDSSARVVNVLFPLSDGMYECKALAIDAGGLKSDVTIDTFLVSGASEYVFRDTGWSMISIPSKMYPVSNLKNTKYLLNWDESGVEKQVYSYYRKKEELTDMEGGKAYWRKGNSNDTIHFAVSAFEKDVTTIALNKTVSGWNQISSPYPYPVAWPGKSDVLWRWNSKLNDYEEVQNVLEPWKGYWVRVDTAVTVTLSPVPVFGTGTLAKLRKSYFQNKDNWTLQVSIRTDSGNDIDNKFGFSQNATDKYDELDRPEPPGFEGRPVLYFNHDEWKTGYGELASDIRKNWKSVNIFEFVLSGSKEGENGILSFDGLEGTANLYVFTKIGDSLVQVEGNANYSVPLSKSKSYQTVFVTDNAKFLLTFPLRFKMGNPYPNPFCPSTRINYTIPYRWSGDGKINLAPYTVTIDIYDILGRKLRCLVYRKMTPGNYSVMWNGKSENGRIVASGKYYCVLKADELKQVRNLTLIK
ncbi:MAG TPA: hypothetical protein VHO70_02010 [Chitinispirillaceae bacterium]|nr:hypothetical protein [Chitinispirillaceae bacterium]